MKLSNSLKSVSLAVGTLSALGGATFGPQARAQATGVLIPPPSFEEKIKLEACRQEDKVVFTLLYPQYLSGSPERPPQEPYYVWAAQSTTGPWHIVPTGKNLALVPGSDAMSFEWRTNSNVFITLSKNDPAQHSQANALSINGHGARTAVISWQASCTGANLESKSMCSPGTEAWKTERTNLPPQGLVIMDGLWDSRMFRLKFPQSQKD